MYHPGVTFYHQETPELKTSYPVAVVQCMDVTGTEPIACRRIRPRQGRMLTGTASPHPRQRGGVPVPVRDRHRFEERRQRVISRTVVEGQRMAGNARLVVDETRSSASV
jgi:hypothetical protein